MKKILKIYNFGYEDGMLCAIDDIEKNKKKRFKKIDEKTILSKLYDLGYIDGYNRFYFVYKKYLYFKDKL